MDWQHADLHSYGRSSNSTTRQLVRTKYNVGEQTTRRQLTQTVTRWSHRRSTEGWTTVGCIRMMCEAALALPPVANISTSAMQHRCPYNCRVLFLTLPGCVALHYVAEFYCQLSAWKLGRMAENVLDAQPMLLYDRMTDTFWGEILDSSQTQMTSINIPSFAFPNNSVDKMPSNEISVLIQVLRLFCVYLYSCQGSRLLLTRQAEAPTTILKLFYFKKNHSKFVKIGIPWSWLTKTQRLRVRQREWRSRPDPRGSITASCIFRTRQRRTWKRCNISDGRPPDTARR